MQNVFKCVLSGIFIILTSALFPIKTNASETQLVLNYDGFFDRMEDLDEAKYQDIKLAFYFMDVNGKACPIKSVTLKTQLDKMEVYNLPSGEILLPFDHQLDADKAAIVIDKVDAKQCGLDMRLETSILLDEHITIEKTKSLIQAFDLALNDLAGMMAFTLPDVVGITFKSKFDEVLEISNTKAGQCKLNTCTLTLADLDQYQDTLEFSHTLVKAVPYIK